MSFLTILTLSFSISAAILPAALGYNCEVDFRFTEGVPNEQMKALRDVYRESDVCDKNSAYCMKSYVRIEGVIAYEHLTCASNVDQTEGLRVAAAAIGLDEEDTQKFVYLDTECHSLDAKESYEVELKARLFGMAASMTMVCCKNNSCVRESETPPPTTTTTPPSTPSTHTPPREYNCEGDFRITSGTPSDEMRRTAEVLKSLEAECPKRSSPYCLGLVLGNDTFSYEHLQCPDKGENSWVPLFAGFTLGPTERRSLAELPGKCAELSDGESHLESFQLQRNNVRAKGTVVCCKKNSCFPLPANSATTVTHFLP